MRKPRSFQLGEPGPPHFYHVVSRVAGREVLFGDAERNGENSGRCGICGWRRWGESNVS